MSALRLTGVPPDTRNLMRLKTVVARSATLALLAMSAVVWFPQAASAAPSLSITAAADPNSTDTGSFTVSGEADEASYLYVFTHNTENGACAATAAAEQSADVNEPDQGFPGGYDVSAGSFSETGTFPASLGSYVLCSYLTAASEAAESSPPDAAAVSSPPVVFDACPPAPSVTLSHISFKTVKNGPEFDGSGTLTVTTNQPDGDVTATDQTGFVSDSGGSDSGAYQVKVYDNGPGAPQPGDTRTYTIVFTPQDPGQCYDTSEGSVVNGSAQPVTQTLTVTWFSVGQGGRGSVGGSVIPGSDTETTVPGAPSPTVSGHSHVGDTDTCSATAPSRDSAGAYTWSVGGTEVATGRTFEIPASAYRQHLTCSARAFNNAAKPGPAGTSESVIVGSGPALKSTSSPAFDGETRAGGTIRVTHGSWSPRANSYAYQWYGGSHKIRGARDPRYKIAKKYKGKRITCRVTASAHGYADGVAKPKAFRVV